MYHTSLPSLSCNLCIDFIATGTATTVETTTTTSSRGSGHTTTDLEFTATTETEKNMDYTTSEYTTETSVSNPIFTQSNDVTTTVNQSDINDEEITNSINNRTENALRNYVVITATTVPIGIILLITMILSMSVVIVFVTISRRRKTKLLNFKRRRSSGHHHIGLGKH